MLADRNHRALHLLNAFRETLTQRLDVALAEEKLMENIAPVQLIDQKLRPSLVPLAQEFNISPAANDFFWNLTQCLTHGNAAVCEAFLRQTKMARPSSTILSSAMRACRRRLRAFIGVTRF